MRPAPTRQLFRRTALFAATALVLPALTVGASAAVPARAAGQPAGPTVGGLTPTLPSRLVVAGLTVENSFVSGVGWVKPGDTYPSRVLLTNAGTTAVGGVSVSVPPVTGMSWSGARASTGAASLSGGTVRWSVPSVPAGSTLALVLEAKAKTTAQEPTVVWRDISSIASVTVGKAAPVKIASHGPKVIPPTGGFETARYGDRPFPVVPVDYADFTHTASAADLDTTINDPKNPSSTFNLFQEMSFGQLYPAGDVGSVGIA
ncbi:MAG: hypothetical protein H7323_12850, partial [Frankiales bacterium]|nr:hypothetical protein [Frankiales bacterium]